MPKAKKIEDKTEKAEKKSEKKVTDVTVESAVKKVKKVAKKESTKEEIAPEPSAEKKVIIEQYAVKDGDTGSPEVQVALLTNRIEKLILHLKTNHSDNHSRRGLLGIVSKRRRLLNYLEKQDAKRYGEVTKKLGLGK